MSEQSIGKITIADGVVVIQRNNQSIELQERDYIYLNDIVEHNFRMLKLRRPEQEVVSKLSPK